MSDLAASGTLGQMGQALLAFMPGQRAFHKGVEHFRVGVRSGMDVFGHAWLISVAGLCLRNASGRGRLQEGPKINRQVARVGSQRFLRGGAAHACGAEAIKQIFPQFRGEAFDLAAHGLASWDMQQARDFEESPFIQKPSGQEEPLFAVESAQSEGERLAKMRE